MPGRCRRIGLRTLARRVALGLLPFIPPLLVAALPTAAVVIGSRAVHVVPVAMLWRPLSVGAAAAVLLVLCARHLTPSRLSQSAAASVFLLLLSCYPTIDAAMGTGGVWLRRAGAFASIFAMGWGAMKFARRCGLPELVLASIVVATPLVWIGVGEFRDRVAEPVWSASVRRISHEADRITLPPVGRPPDIYYVILDGLARPDVLASRFGLQTARFAHALEQRGFQIPARARTNYGQTATSMASSLNMAYLDGLTDTMGAGMDMRPLSALIQQSGAVRLLRRHGYEFVMIGSDTGLTATHEQADRCICSLPPGPNELEYILLSLTPARAFGLDEWSFGAHRAKVLEQFKEIEGVRSERPMFVLAHVLSPHPPFVFAADGSPAAIRDEYSLHDGDLFQGSRQEYRAGYAAQAQFVLQRLVDVAIALTSRPAPAIVIFQADHGSGLSMSNTDTTRTDAVERLAIFAAYFAPGTPPEVPVDMSPVNSVRWALNAAFDARVSLLPNRSFLSSYANPFVTSEVKP